MSEHPRLKNFPWIVDYRQPELGLQFRPFIMSTHGPNYRSKAVNTDRFGLRRQFDLAGREIDLDTAVGRYPACRVLTGNSATFGVDVSSDKNTVSAHLQQAGIPCINLGVRGATAAQEIQLFLHYKKYLPKVLDVILFTGVNECSLASMDSSFFYSDFGGFFNEEYISKSFCMQYEMFVENKCYRTRKALSSKFDLFLARHPKVSKALGRLLLRKCERTRNLKPRLSFRKKLEIMIGNMANTLESWGALQRGLGFKVHFVLQPVIGWNTKSLTTVESACHGRDVEKLPSINDFACRDVHTYYSQFLQENCAKHDIAYHDANSWLSQGVCDDVSIFADVCHLLDAGTKFVGKRILTELDFQSV